MNEERKAIRELFRIYVEELDPHGDMGLSVPGNKADLFWTFITAVKALMLDRESLSREKQELTADNDELEIIIDGLLAEIDRLRFVVEDLQVVVSHSDRRRGRKSRRNRKQ